MSDEITKILAMVKEGKVSPEEGSELIQALGAQTKEAGETSAQKKLQIVVHSSSREKVFVAIPLKFVKTMIKIGRGFAFSFPQTKEYAEYIDMKLIMHAIDNDIEGDIINVHTPEGDTVVISIE